MVLPPYHVQQHRLRAGSGHLGPVERAPLPRGSLRTPRSRTVSVGPATDIAKVLSVAGSGNELPHLPPHRPRVRGGRRVGGSRAPAHPASGDLEVQDVERRIGPVLARRRSSRTSETSGPTSTTASRAARSPRRHDPSTSLLLVDIVRFRDWLRARLQENLFLLLANADKVSL